MDWQARLNRALDRIEAGIEGELSWAEVAREANCSLFHFMRMFEVVAGVGAAEYLRRRRLSRAAGELAGGGARVIDLALRYGYETPEAFSKAFRREFGMSPTEAREPGATLRTWPRLTVSIVLKGSEAMEYRIENRPAFGITGLPLEVSVVDGRNYVEIPAFWKRLMEDGSYAALWKCALAKHGFGVMGVCAGDMDEKRESFTYLVGIESPAERAGLPPGCVDLAVGAHSWAVFPSRGPLPGAIQAVWKRIMAEWFPGAGYEHADAPDLEVYSAGDASSADYYSEIWIPVVKAGD